MRNFINVIEVQAKQLEFYLSSPALDCITYGFLQELSGNLKQREPDHGGAYLSKDV